MRGPVYENFTVPNGGGVTATTEKVPEPAVRKSGGGRLKKSQIDEDFSEVDEDDVYNRPRVNTIDDLWWMVWQEGITQIVMLANLQEDGKDKCEEYWPAAGKSQTYGQVTVRGLEEQQRADYAIRSFVLKAAGAQYKFLHEVVLEAHTGRATRVTVSQFDFIFPDNIEVKKDNARIDKEFQMLKQMGQFAKPNNSMATMPENRDKNRNMDVLPDNDHLAYLTSYVRGRTQYINAVYLPYWPRTSGEVLTAGPYSITMDAFSKLGTCLHSYRLNLKSETQYRYLYKAAQEYIRHVGVYANSGVR
nr:hypothetical protein BaRGS_004280 [Batillaria attramentaria]